MRHFFSIFFYVFTDQTIKQMNQEMRQSVFSEMKISCSPTSNYFTQARIMLRENHYPLVLHIRVCLWVLGSPTVHVKK